MEKALFKIVDICQSNHVEQTFIQELHHYGLIEIITEQQEEYIDEEQLPQLNRFTALYYELNINIQGIEIVHNLLNKIEILQEEINLLKNNRL